MRTFELHGDFRFQFDADKAGFWADVYKLKEDNYQLVGRGGGNTPEQAMGHALQEANTFLLLSEDSSADRDKLAKYLLSHWVHELGRYDPVHGESAADIAIRLLEKLRLIMAANGEIRPR